MPALLFVILLVALFWLLRGSVFIALFVWAILNAPLADAVANFCRANHLEGDWAIMITLGINGLVIALIGAFFAWRMWRLPAKRTFYLNLLILTVGIPGAIAFGVAITHVPT